MKSWMIAGSVVVGLAAVLLLSDRPQTTPGGVHLIRGQGEYFDANTKAQNLSMAIFKKSMSAAPITEDDKSKLKEAAKYFEAMSLYKPDRIQTYVGWGMCLMLNGEKQKAAEKFSQAILNKQIDPDRDTDAARLTIFETNALLSEVCLDLASEEIGNYNSMSQAGDKTGAEAAKKRSEFYYNQALSNANDAVKGVPTAYRYLVDRANVLMAIGKKDLAKEDLLKAKSLAPNDPRVLMSAKLMGL